MTRVAVIGAGVAGMSAAQLLKTAAVHVVLFDKGRRPGGRLSSTPTPSGLADHGAQFVRPSAPALITELRRSPAVRAWRERHRDGRDALVGVPSNRSLALWWAEGLNVRSSAKVTTLQREGAQWTIGCEAGSQHGFDACLVTLPAPQAEALLAASSLCPSWRSELAEITYAPCWTIVAEPLGEPRLPHDAAPAPPFRWCAPESAKPNRTGSAWVAQADPDWSRDHLEASAEDAGRALLYALSDATGAPFELVRAHRWRFAEVERALNKPSCFDASLRLGYASDGCLGGRVESAWLSGRDAAERLLDSI